MVIDHHHSPTAENSYPYRHPLLRQAGNWRVESGAMQYVLHCQNGVYDPQRHHRLKTQLALELKDGNEVRAVRFRCRENPGRYSRGATVTNGVSDLILVDPVNVGKYYKALAQHTFL